VKLATVFTTLYWPIPSRERAEMMRPPATADVESMVGLADQWSHPSLVPADSHVWVLVHPEPFQYLLSERRCKATCTAATPMPDAPPLPGSADVP
jgi:hypothetical protein